MWSKYNMIPAVVTAVAAFVCAIGAAELAPTMTPTTKPIGVAVRGHVSVSGGFALQKPDLTRVVVYLASDPTLDAVPHSPESAVVAQRNKTFIPNFVVVPRGTEVEFPNWDNFDHNVFSRSKAAPEFDLLRYPRGESKTRTFDKVGVVQIFCNIHPTMRAMVYITPNVFFARADADGNFQIDGLPPGSYEVVAWQERCDEQRQSVNLSTDRPSDLTFTLQESRARVLSTTDDRKNSYGVERGLGVKLEQLNLPVVTDSHPAPPDTHP